MKLEKKFIEFVRLDNIVKSRKILQNSRKNSYGLLNKPININYQIENGLCAAHFAAQNGSFEILKLIFECGGDLERPDCQGFRPLHYSAAFGRILAVKFLLVYAKCQSNVRSIEFFTPIQLAVINGHSEIVKILLDSFADPLISNCFGQNALTYAHIDKKFDIVNLIQFHIKRSSDFAVPNEISKCLQNFSSNRHCNPIQPLSNKIVRPQSIFLTSAVQSEFFSVKKISPRITSFESADYLNTSSPSTCSCASSSPNSQHLQSRLLSSASIDKLNTCKSFTSVRDAALLSSATSLYSFRENNSAAIIGPFAKDCAADSASLSNSTNNSFSEKSSECSSSGIMHSSYSLSELDPNVFGLRDLKQNLKDACFAVQARAICDFHGTGVSFQEGDLITILRQFNEQFWIGYVTSHGISATAVIPANLVELVDPKRIPIKPRNLNLARPEWLDNQNGCSSFLESNSTCINNEVHPMDARDRLKFGYEITTPNLNGGDDRFSNSIHSPLPISTIYEQSNILSFRKANINSHNLNSTNNQRNSGASWDSGRGSANASSFGNGKNLFAGSSYVVTSILGSTEPPHSSNVSLTDPNQLNFSSNCLPLANPNMSLSEFLTCLKMENYIGQIVNAGYDLFSLSRATPEDLTSLGITSPVDRSQLKRVFRIVKVPNNLPTTYPKNLVDCLVPLQLDDYISLLNKFEVNTLSELSKLGWEDLIEMGVRRLGHLKQFNLLIDRLKALQSQKFSCQDRLMNSFIAQPTTDTLVPSIDMSQPTAELPIVREMKLDIECDTPKELSEIISMLKELEMTLADKNLIPTNT